MTCSDDTASTIFEPAPPVGPSNAEAETRDSHERATDFVESLDRGLRLLQKFGATDGPMTLSDLARAADLPRATARRILFTLERGGFVASDGKLFTLTPHVLDARGILSAFEPGGDGAATGAGSDCDGCAGDQFARGARRRRGRVHRPRQSRAGVLRGPRYRLPAAGVLHLGRPRPALAVIRHGTGRCARRDGPEADDPVHCD